MTNEQAKKMLKSKLECLKRETSGTDFDCNNSNCDECSLCYEQGNMGEQKEALDMAIKALEQQPCEDTISRQAAIETAHLPVIADAGYEVVRMDDILALPSVQPEPIKINIDDFNKEDLERLKKELGNTPITVLPAQSEIIRCKDCKWKNNHNCTRAVEVWIDDDKFCAWAERRTDE